MKRKYLVLGIFVLAVLAACTEKKDKQGHVLDTPTTGSIKIMADEGYKPIIETTIDVFDSIYRLAKITPIYTSEGAAVNALIRDSIQVIVITRKLTEEELKFFKQRGFVPPTTPIAHDAVAFVVNPANNDTVFTIEQMRNIVTGNISKWKEINPISTLNDILLVLTPPSPAP